MPHERRTLWSEELPFEQLCRPSVLGPLASRDVELVVAVRPSSLSGLASALAACERAGVKASAWPMLDDRDGRWASVTTMARYCAFVDRVLDALGRGSPCLEIAFDLEPPIAEVRAALDHKRALVDLLRRHREGEREARSRLAECTDRVASLGMTPAAAIVPVLLADGPRKGLERLLGTPASAGSFERFHAMMYTSLVEGYAPRLARRADCRALLFDGCLAAARRLGPRASVSLGVVGPGALGDERPYRDVGELADDVGIARSAGVTDIALFDLHSALRRPPLEPWLDALVGSPALARPPPPTARSLAARAALAALGAALR